MAIENTTALASLPGMSNALDGSKLTNSNTGDLAADGFNVALKAQFDLLSTAAIAVAANDTLPSISDSGVSINPQIPTTNTTNGVPLAVESASINSQIATANTTVVPDVTPSLLSANGRLDNLLSDLVPQTPEEVILGDNTVKQMQNATPPTFTTGLDNTLSALVSPVPTEVMSDENTSGSEFANQTQISNSNVSGDGSHDGLQLAYLVQSPVIAAQSTTTPASTVKLITTPEPELPISNIEETANSGLLKAETLQASAALLGKNLPGAKKSAKDINLEETLQTLAAIMARIPEVNATDTSTQSPASLLENTNTPAEAATNTNTAQSTADASVLSMLQVGLPQTPSRSVSSMNASGDSQPVLNNTDNSNEQKLGLANTLTVPQQRQPSLALATGNAGLTQTSQTATPSATKAAFDDALLAQNGLVQDEANLKSNLAAMSDVLTGAIDNNSKNISGVSFEPALLDKQGVTSPKVEVPPMSAHVYSAKWNEDLGSKILWMTGQGLASAELKLNPEHLGPISIQVDMQKDQANISFTAQNAGVKELLEASIPKLREMLQTQQLNLAEVNVSQNTSSGQGQPQTPYFGQQPEGQKQPHPETDTAATSESLSVMQNEAVSHIEESRRVISKGLLNLFA